MEITDNEIALLESVLSRPNEPIRFDEQRRAVIRMVASCDIQACPGSGKTTVLHAKLHALSRRYPFEDKRCVCVLTHTNVAINEIVARFRYGNASILTPPNFCGTIQQFVNRFLAIPWYIHKTGHRPFLFDAQWYGERWLRSSKGLDSAFSYFARNAPPDMELWQQLANMRFSLKRFDVIVKNILEEQPCIGIETNTYKLLSHIKTRIFNEGYLCYDDAYSLAFEYLREVPEVLDCLRARFKYVFIDEHQDTNSYQYDLLQKIFSGSSCVVQTFGDKNQAIYRNTKECDHSEPEQNLASSRIAIDSSQRLPQAVANAVRNVCVAPHASLGGWSQEPSIPPIAIIYDFPRILDVIPKFSELVIEYGVNSKDSVVKAVAAVRKPNGHAERQCLTDYVSSLSNEDLSDSRNKAIASTPREVLHTALSTIVEVLRNKGRKIEGKTGRQYEFTESRLTSDLLTKYHNEYLAFRSTIATQALVPKSPSSASLEIATFIIDTILPLYLTNLDQTNSDLVLATDYFAPLEAASLRNAACSIVHAQDDITLTIQFDTIHGVKGETHDATLFLETFNHDYDIRKLLPFFLGEDGDRSAPRISKFLRLGYVAVTRPKRLLCIAFHNQHHVEKKSGVKVDTLSKEMIQKLKDAGWRIIRLESPRPANTSVTTINETDSAPRPGATFQ